MHITLTLMALGMLFFQAAGQEKQTDRDYDELVGPVRVVRTEAQYLRDKTGNPKDNGRQLERIVVYDRAGRMTEELDINSYVDTCTRSRRVFNYDAEGNRTEAVYWGAGVTVGTQAAATQKPATPLLFKQSFKYDGSGRRTEVQEYDTLGRRQSKIQFKYDDKGRVKERIEAYQSGGEGGCTFKYKDQGPPSEETCAYGPMGANNRTTFAYEYDARGNWIKKMASVTSVFPNGQTHESQHIVYRRITYYSEASEADSADRFDGYKPVACAAPMVIRKSGGVLQQSAIKRVAPAYPPAAAAAGISGAVMVEITTDEMGKVIAVKSISGPAELRAAAEEAARSWEFQPTSLSKVPVKVIGTLTFNFNR
ncbi:MAG TPA: TonB family protein [Blastocatellia bacterium]|nr:TonB family protein [Blastocatellia bacterium]